MAVDNLTLNGNTIISSDAAGDINITPDTTGDLVLDGLKWPQADGTADYVLKTDGSAQLSWVAQSGGGLNHTAATGGETLTSADCGGIIHSESTQDIVLPDCAAGTLGCKIQIFNQDATETTTVSCDGTGDVGYLIDGTSIGLNDEFDLDDTAHSSSTFVCMVANQWWITSQVGVTVDQNP